MYNIVNTFVEKHNADNTIVIIIPRVNAVINPVPSTGKGRFLGVLSK